MSSCYSSRRSSAAGEVNLAVPSTKPVQTSHSPPRSWFEISSHASREAQRESKSEHLDFETLVYKLQRHQLDVEEDELRANLESNVLPQDDGSVLSNLVTSEWQSPAVAGEDTEITAMPVEETHEHDQVNPVRSAQKASTHTSASEFSNKDHATSPTNLNRDDGFKWSNASRRRWQRPRVVGEEADCPDRSQSQLGLDESDLPNLVTSEWDAPVPACDDDNEDAHTTSYSVSQLQRHDSVMDNLVTMEWDTINPACEDQDRTIPVVKEDHCDEADIPNLVTSEWGSSETAGDHTDNLRVPQNLWRTSAFSLANLVTSEWQTPTEEVTDLRFSRRQHRQSQLSGFSFSRSATPEKLVQSPQCSASGTQSPEGSHANRHLSNLFADQSRASNMSVLSSGLRGEQSGKSPAFAMTKSRISRISLSYDRFSYGSPFQLQNIARALSRNSNVSDSANEVEEQLTNNGEAFEEKSPRNSTTSNLMGGDQDASDNPREASIRQSQSSEQSRYSNTVSNNAGHTEHAYHLDQSHMSNSTTQTETENEELAKESHSVTMSKHRISIASASSILCSCDADQERQTQNQYDITDQQRASTTLAPTEVVSSKLLPETPIEHLNELKSLVSANLMTPFSVNIMSYEFPWMEPQSVPSPGRMNRNGRPPPLTLVDTHVPPPEVQSAALPPRSSSKTAMRDYAAQQAFVKRHHRRMTIAGAKDQLDVPHSPGHCIDSDVPPVPDLLYAEGTTTSPPSHSPATPIQDLEMREPDMRQLEEPDIEEEVIETMDLPKSKSSLKRRGMFIEDPKDMLPQVGRSYESNMYATNLAEIDSTPIEHVSDIQPKNSLIRKKSIIGRLVHKRDSDEFLDYYFTAGQTSRTEHPVRHGRSRSISKKLNPFRYPRHGDYDSPPVPVHI